MRIAIKDKKSIYYIVEDLETGNPIPHVQFANDVTGEYHQSNNGVIDVKFGKIKLKKIDGAPRTFSGSSHQRRKAKRQASGAKQKYEQRKK